MFKAVSLAGVIAFLTAGMALASCPSNPPSAASIRTEAGDQRVNAAWLENTLVGYKLRYDIGVEDYRSDGTYRWTESNGTTYDAPSYRFYDNGYRCIGYRNNPRFDFYVVNDRQLVLINNQGRRYVGQLTR